MRNRMHSPTIKIIKCSGMANHKGIRLIKVLCSKSVGLWTLSIVCDSKQPENTMLRELDLFPSSGEGREVLTMLCPSVQLSRFDLSKGPNRPSFRNVVFFNYPEFRTKYKVQKPSVSECYTPSSETFRF
jgi:hypothetical protein